MHLGEERLDGWMGNMVYIILVSAGFWLLYLFPFYNCLVFVYGACFHHVVFTILYHT